MNIKESIKPFRINYGEESASLLMAQELGSYKQHIFDERAKDGFRGCGYDWQSLAYVYLYEKCPQLKEKIKMDSEADMFCVYSKDKKALEDFAIGFHALCENETEMRDLFSRAELD